MRSPIFLSLGEGRRKKYKKHVNNDLTEQIVKNYWGEQAAFTKKISEIK